MGMKYRNFYVIDLSQFDAIIFDMDGTLVDSMGSHLDSWEQVCLKFGYDFDREYMHSLGGVPTPETVRILNDKFGLDHNIDIVSNFKRQTWNAMGHEPTLIPSTTAIFHHYLGIKKIAVGTGSDRLHAEALLTTHDLFKHLDTLVTSTDVDNGKPHPETFLKAAQHVGVAPDKCVVFEDTVIGRQAALSAGMSCIMVENGKVNPNIIQP